MEIEKFSTLVLPLRDKLLSVARRMLQDDNDAEDAVQETMIKLWQYRERLTEHPNVGGYTMQTLKNTCIEKLKSNKYNISIDDVQFDSNAPTPYNNVENKNSVEIVKQIIDRLPQLQKMIITMRDVEEYELSEIAKITASNISAVKVNLSRARKKVRDAYLDIQSVKRMTNA